jgi:Domain of unknown function (DUF4386)
VNQQVAESRPMTYARVAGLLYLAIFIVAPFAEFFVRQGLIVAGDPATTAANIRASEGLFRAGFAADLSVFVIEVAQAALLYVLFRPVSHVLALVMAFGRLAQAAILGLNLLNMYTGLHLLTSTGALGAFDQAQVNGLALVFLNAQSAGYEIGLAYFGLHLAILGYLIYRSGFLPRWLGVLTVTSAIGYLANTFTLFLLPEWAEVMAVAVLGAALIGELPLTMWLLVKGVNVDRWRARAAGLVSPITQQAGRLDAAPAGGVR